MMMQHGYTLNYDEVLTALAGAGCSDTCGLPIVDTVLDAERQTAAVRSLVRKNVLTYRDGQYAFSEPFGSVFSAMKDCGRTVRMVSKDVTDEAHVCYPLGDGKLAVWAIGMRGRGKAGLYVTKTADFIAGLEESGFIPRYSEYCEPLPDHIADGFMGAYEELKCGRFTAVGGVRIGFMMTLDIKSGGRTFAALSRCRQGSIMTIGNDNGADCIGYDNIAFRRCIEKCIERGEIGFEGN